MQESELIRKLNSVGKTIFVEYFSIFKSYAEERLSKEDFIELLVKNNISNANGAAIRCSNAKLIFKANMEYEALKLIAISKRLDPIVINKAQELIVEHKK